MATRGIDYGNGLTNVDRETGIRFGVIPQNVILQRWSDSSEPDYGKPHCPHCGNECQEVHEIEGDLEGFETDSGASGDYGCTDCKRLFDGESTFGDDPLGYTFDDEGYKAHSDSYGDVWITKSPFYTRAQFCSPCAPGACYLSNPCDDGEKAYCFAADWFDDDIESCPYPVWRVDNDELIYTPAVSAD